MYPPCSQPELTLGVESHTDVSALTLLIPNDVLGLQVWKDDYWIDVDYLQNAFFIQVGDQLFKKKNCFNQLFKKKNSLIKFSNKNKRDQYYL